MCCHVVVGSPGQPAGKPRVAGPMAKRRDGVRRPWRSQCAALAAPELLQTCSVAMSRVLKETLSFDAVARQPGTVGAAVGAAVASSDGGGGGGALRGTR